MRARDLVDILGGDLDAEVCFEDVYFGGTDKELGVDDIKLKEGQWLIWPPYQGPGPDDGWME